MVVRPLHEPATRHRTPQRASAACARARALAHAQAAGHRALGAAPCRAALQGGRVTNLGLRFPPKCRRTCTKRAASHKERATACVSAKPQQVCLMH
jgi:hypothetical protein